eukprot:gnl/MRDRNA2_/MRDRNA2_65062_c0_seq1.p2 gnl/MRDRNA2_/MRDRNA2_65062_c0~~gnl/MRDRNA2_/MRDRNA2_65062_c0_seq1.p2  ORF type:complete len:109 (+),score=30.49 gnl/MRDRNA2_/MRDRNA2_65062_c0_seq1:66-392(+)
MASPQAAVLTPIILERLGELLACSGEEVSHLLPRLLKLERDGADLQSIIALAEEGLGKDGTKQLLVECMARTTFAASKAAPLVEKEIESSKKLEESPSKESGEKDAAS